MSDTFRCCGRPRTEENSYVCNGRPYCRACHLRRVCERGKRKRLGFLLQRYWRLVIPVEDMQEASDD